MFLTIITPTYNRKRTLYRCYESLRRQRCKDFQWLIIDDGSTDGTRDYISCLKKKNEMFDIDYFYKANGGKHTALNYAMAHIKGDIVAILDSDDYLIDDAIDEINHYWGKYENRIEIMEVCFRKKLINKKNKHFPRAEFIENHINFVENNRYTADSFEVVRTSVFCEYPYPEFENEKFLGESVFRCRSAKKYQSVYVDEALCICEYLSDGLTQHVREININSPKGCIYRCSLYFDKKYSFRLHVKNMLLYIIFSFFGREKMRVMKNMASRYMLLFYILLIPGYLIYRYWKHKYVKEIIK